jgi:hypothetical protein
MENLMPAGHELMPFFESRRLYHHIVTGWIRVNERDHASNPAYRPGDTFQHLSNYSIEEWVKNEIAMMD